MRCGNYLGGIILQCGKDGYGKRRTLYRVSTAAKLVYQHQRALIRHAQYLYNIGHVRGESGQALFDALLISDIHIYTAENADNATVARRYHKSAHGHERQQTHCLDSYCLTARIRACDDKAIIALAYLHGNRHYGICVYKRMSCIMQNYLWLVRYLRRNAFHLRAKICLCKIQLQYLCHTEIVHDGVGVLTYLLGKLTGDTLYLRLLAGFQHAYLVVCLNYAHRLDKECLTRSRGVMHQTGDIVLVLGAHRHNVSSVTHGDDILLQIFLRILVLDELIQLLTDVQSLPYYPLSYGGKLGACAVRHLLLGDDAVGNTLLKVLDRIQLGEVFIKAVFNIGALAVPIAQHTCFTQYLSHVKQLTEAERRTTLAALE